MVKVSQLCLRLQFLVKLCTVMLQAVMLRLEGSCCTMKENLDQMRRSAFLVMHSSSCLNIYLLISDFILFYFCVYKAWPAIIRHFSWTGYLLLARANSN